MVRANRELQGQAVFNLLDNAIKYSARDGAEAGPIGAVRVTLARSSDRVEIRIGDRGPGIAPQDRDRALERFVRLDKSRTQPGTGLGLSLVAAVMRLHGGTIRLASNEPGLVVILAMPPATEGTIAT
jgi:signal transduction histidine kinase